MHHLLKQKNQDIYQGDKAKIRTQQQIKLNTGAKKNPTGKPRWAKQTAKASGPYHLINR